MKLKPISLYTISLFALLMLCATTAVSQEEFTNKDTIVVKQKYGLRLGGDLSKLARSFIDDTYKGFEIVGDYRFTNKLYLAGELGVEERMLTNDYLDVTTSGSYFKAGVDYNLYANWLDMENMIYAGFRIGASTFKQTLNSYTIYNTNQYWQAPFKVDQSQQFNGLTALWTELIIGIKAETLNNLYIGLNVQLKGRLTDKKPGDFENLYIPGFNRTYDSGRFGMGYSYTISYLIPIFKKDKKIVND